MIESGSAISFSLDDELVFYKGVIDLFYIKCHLLDLDLPTRSLKDHRKARIGTTLDPRDPERCI